MAGPSIDSLLRLPARPIDTILSPFQRFARVEAAGGIMLLVCTVVALVWANSPWAASYDTFWHTYVKVGFGDHVLKLSLAHFVNDGLMAIFFFVVGLEIKREMLVGELASPRKAVIPIAAAIGGMAVPSLVYAACLWGRPEIRGWAIPAATDIAFAIGIMAMLGRRVPVSLKIFLTALAIADDIGAVLVIAIFYTKQLLWLPLGVAGVLLLVAVIANASGVRTTIVYGIIGILMWVMLLKSGVHATIGGVLLALAIPAAVRIRGGQFTEFARRTLDEFERAGGDQDDVLSNPGQQSAVMALEHAAEYVQPPLTRVEHGLAPYVAFLIMPIFALANAGVSLEGLGSAFSGLGVGSGIALGLVLGKPVGIALATFLAVRLGLGRLPDGTNWKQIIGAGCLAGIGFTMSMFIANLAFDPGADPAAAQYAANSESLKFAKAGILGGSLVAGVLGFVLLRLFGRDPDAT